MPSNPPSPLREVFILDIARDGFITNRTFRNKRIMGPAVLYVKDAKLENCGAHGDVEGTLWRFPSGKLIQGVIRVENCNFFQCTFENIGWVSDDPEALAEQVGWMYDGDPTPPQAFSPHKRES